MLNYDQRIRLLEIATETAGQEDIVSHAVRLEQFVLDGSYKQPTSVAELTKRAHNQAN